MTKARTEPPQPDPGRPGGHRRSGGRRRAAEPARQRWYLLIHQLPPKPLYLRAKIRQRLHGVGAAPLKKSVYVLPRREECLERFQRIAQEAIAGGGEAYVCAAEFSDVATEKALLARFAAERSADYEALERELRPTAVRRSPTRLAQARKRFEEVAAIDFFGAPGRRRVDRRLRRLEAAARRNTKPRSAGDATSLGGRTWVTRRGLHVDRIASAWLVRRFVDPHARFRFVDASASAAAGEVAFDMVGGDFTHEEDRCTFETLLARLDLPGRALRNLAEIVHDVDLKDGKFGRAEAAGLERVLTGLLLANPGDDARLERGLELFDELYEAFGGDASGARKGASR